MKKALLALIVIFVLYCVYWATGRSMMLSALTGGIKNLTSEGYEIDHKGLSAGGFPFKFRSSFNEPGLVSPRSDTKPWSIKADNLVLEASTFRPTHWSATHRGKARIDLRGPQGQRWLFGVKPFSVDIDLQARLSGELKGVKAVIMRPKAQAVIGTLPPIVGLDEAQIDARPHKGDMHYDLSAENIFLNKDTWPKLQAAFGPHITRIDMTILAKDLTSLDEDARENWRKDGTLICEDAHINWGSNKFSGGCEFTTSEAGLTGQLWTEVEDLPHMINQLSAAGTFTEKQARSIKLGALLLPKNENGDKEVIFNVRDGYLLLFGQRLYKF